MAKKKAAKKAPRQKALPGMQDRRVAILETAALKYADFRDERMDWTKKEVEAKKRVKVLMHEQGRKHYVRGNIEITLKPKTEDEDVIVRVRDREQTPGVDEPPPVEEPESPENQWVENHPEEPDEEPDEEPPPKAADSPDEL